MSRIFVLLLFLIFFILCSEPVQPPNYIFAHNFGNPIAENLFTRGVNQTADSLDVESVLLSLREKYDKKHLDSLLKNTHGIAYSPPLQNEVMAEHLEKALKKQKPIIQFENAKPTETIYRFINSDSYTAGRAAAQFIVDQFGDNGRFGILTPTLDNRESTEAIRGFRDKLSKTKWKQVNIITCGNEFEQALKQYRYATRFGNRIIWFVANDCPDFLHELKNLKKDNFFIAIDLHPNENNIKFLQENMLDAIATKNFAAMGRLCVTELVSAPLQLDEIESETINCGSTVLTSAQLLELLQ